MSGALAAAGVSGAAVMCGSRAVAGVSGAAVLYGPTSAGLPSGVSGALLEAICRETAVRLVALFEPEDCRVID